MSYDVVLLSCKFTSWCVPPFLHLFRKFGGDEITLVAEADYSTEIRCIFSQLPNNLIINGECPKHYFSDSLIHAIKNTKNDNIVIMLADYFLVDKINFDLLEKCDNYLNKHNDVLRIDIGNQTRPNPPKWIGDGEWICECSDSRDCFYPISLCPGIWNKKLLLSLLSPGWDPWGTENRLYEKFMNNISLKSLWANQSIDYINVMRARDNNNIVMNKLIYDDIKRFIPTRFKFNLD